MGIEWEELLLLLLWGPAATAWVQCRDHQLKWKDKGKLMLFMMVDGDMDLLLLVRVKKKERQEEPSSSSREEKKNGTWIKSSRRCTSMGKIKYYYYYYSEDRWWNFILLSFDFPPASLWIFLSSNFHSSKDKKPSAPHVVLTAPTNTILRWILIRAFGLRIISAGKTGLGKICGGSTPRSTRS